ncbi:MAG: NAD-dependent epimerase/dehydratase family protein [Thermodesulfobacteriota bacterium]|jgi:nucleoside-diphosphate-sugar epimerase
MKTIDKSRPVMVTGGTGYMASWIIKMLLEEGINVNATVRDPSDAQKIEHLTALAKASPGKLKLFKAHLLDFGSFDDPMQGCELVMHTASPFFITKPKNPEEELLRPAKEGTRNVLEAARRTPTVKRVVLTSSVAAIYGDSVDTKLAPGGVFTEKEWNVTSSAAHLPYYYSKTIAEKEAWAIAREQDQWDLLTINPGVILGPSVSKRTDSTSIGFMIQFGDGTYKSGAPAMSLPFVDVRDVASAHIRAGFTPKASGRHIISGGETTLLELGNILRTHFGDAYPFPRRQAPKFLFWLIAPRLGYTRKYVSRNVGHQMKFDNSYSKADLGMSYIPIEQTVKDHFQQILDDGLLGKTVSGR